jgi:hypothetical protein
MSSRLCSNASPLLLMLAEADCMLPLLTLLSLLQTSPPLMPVLLLPPPLLLM